MVPDILMGKLHTRNAVPKMVDSKKWLYKSIICARKDSPIKAGSCLGRSRGGEQGLDGAMLLIGGVILAADG